MENVVNALERASEPDGLISRHLVERSVAHKGPNIPGSVQSATSSGAPVVVIEGTGRSGQELRELWAHRDLFYFLAWRDVKVRYQQTVLGAAWAILQPLISMVVFTIIFGRLARVPSEGVPYAIFSYAGLLAWNFFSTAVTNGSNSLIGSSNIITKVYFPRVIVPAAAVGASLVDIAIASLMLFAIMPFYGIGFHASLFMLIPLVALTALAAGAFAIWTSALNVKYRDIRYALPFAIQIMMFLTPVIYPVNLLPVRWQWVLRLNPLSGIIEGFRDAIFGRAFNWTGLGASAAVTLLLLVASIWIFRRMEQEFADVI